MYIPGALMCLSFTGPYKTLKLGKGGAILTDNEEAYKWLKRARFSGRNECSYLEDTFDMLGWNFYMMPEIAARGLQLMDGMPLHNEPISHRYPDLSLWPIFT
jgi:dTDP-4-amino-4,6-dideoxygalactose transaminase